MPPSFLSNYKMICNKQPELAHMPYKWEVAHLVNLRNSFSFKGLFEKGIRRYLEDHPTSYYSATMVGKSPEWGCSLTNKGYQLLTKWDDPPSMAWHFEIWWLFFNMINFTHKFFGKWILVLFWFTWFSCSANHILRSPSLHKTQGTSSSFRKFVLKLQLMEEIMHYLGCMKQYKLVSPD